MFSLKIWFMLLIVFHAGNSQLVHVAWPYLISLDEISATSAHNPLTWTPASTSHLSPRYSLCSGDFLLTENPSHLTCTQNHIAIPGLANSKNKKKKQPKTLYTLYDGHEMDCEMSLVYKFTVNVQLILLYNNNYNNLCYIIHTSE